MRARVLRGFCIEAGNYAVIGQEVDLPDQLYRMMLSTSAIEPLPDVAMDQPAPSQPALITGDVSVADAKDADPSENTKGAKRR